MKAHLSETEVTSLEGKRYQIIKYVPSLTQLLPLRDCVDN